ncbi:PalH-domain-containing protein [Nadsonia fulvescens var. elongata DSM 6958]|uniref:pH-response regulator protein palH/RIM21 n=1 Tax=Nadsonia fulvescens var. elongata DSM 6958 TaxID=857566 RepID=A0A1E3PS61_9ASCO|nr:PalH-domain-containing protein [Nadsonia fulvescens var. elongata DSM 6958]
MVNPGIYSPACKDNPHSVLELDMLNRTNVPFYGSVTPIAYTVSATTVVAWCLFILLFIAQKPRPWLQKLASCVVAVTLTIALNNAVVELEKQYNKGYNDAEELRNSIFGGLYYRILDVLSRVILWLAHLQVILRLFNQPKRRKIILNVGIVLIIINTIFWCIVNFKPPVSRYIHSFSDAIHDITYIFETILFAVYAFVIIFYSIRKRVYAYNKDVIPIAIAAITSLFVPLLFFILDACQYWIAGWSDFIRLVGDIAAVVVVWEWVEIIGYLVRKREKRGVLGRQIYEGDMIKFISNGAGHGSAATSTIWRKLLRKAKSLFSPHDNWTFSKTKPPNSIPLVNVGASSSAPEHRQVSDGDAPTTSESNIGNHMGGDISRPLYRLFEGLNGNIHEDITRRKIQGIGGDRQPVPSSTDTTSTSYQVINSQNNNIIFDDHSSIPENNPENLANLSVSTHIGNINPNNNTQASLPVRFSENTRFSASMPSDEIKNNIGNISSTSATPDYNTANIHTNTNSVTSQPNHMSYYGSDDDEIFTVVDRQGFNPDICQDELFAAPAYSTEILPPQVFQRIDGFAEGDYHDDKPLGPSGPSGANR